MIFRCETDEKYKFMVEAEKMGLDASFLLRRMVHLFIKDKIMRQRVLDLQCENDYEKEF